MTVTLTTAATRRFRGEQRDVSEAFVGVSGGLWEPLGCFRGFQENFREIQGSFRAYLGRIRDSHGV